MAHPATGPITPEEMQRIASLPYGAAQQELQKHDPLWGRHTSSAEDDGRPVIAWKVFVTQQVTMQAYARVEARTEEEAMDIVAAMPEGSFSWDYNSSDSVEVQWAEPNK